MVHCPAYALLGAARNEAMAAALAKCGLEACSKRLDDEERCDRTLSLGEQQRLAFARLFLVVGAVGVVGASEQAARPTTL